MAVTTIIKLKRGVKSVLESNNLIYAEGEPVYATDTKELKIGDGVTNYNDLSVITPNDVVIEAPIDGKSYVRLDGDWVELVADVEEAPQDGRQYVRKDGVWVEIIADVEEAPEDDKQYARRNGEWDEILGDTDVRNVKLLSYFLGG